MVKKLISIYREEGCSGLLLRIRHRFHRKTYILHAELKETREPDHGSRFTIAPLTGQLLNRMLIEFGMEIPSEKDDQLTKRMDNGSSDEAFVVMGVQGNILGYCCVSFAHNYDETMEYRYDNQPGNMFIFDCHIFEKHRNQGAFSASIGLLLDEGKRRHYSTAACMVDEGNVYSERAFARLGFVRCKEVHTLHLLRKKINITREINTRL